MAREVRKNSHLSFKQYFFLFERVYLGTVPMKICLVGLQHKQNIPYIQLKIPYTVCL